MGAMRIEHLVVPALDNQRMKMALTKWGEWWVRYDDEGIWVYAGHDLGMMVWEWQASRVGWTW